MGMCNCYQNKGECWGTRERDLCSCGGDETKCDFYPEKRAAAQAREVIKNHKCSMDDRFFVEEVEKHNMTDPLEILNWYRNLYYKESDGTERNIMSCAINDLLVKYKKELGIDKEKELTRLQSEIDTLKGRTEIIGNNGDEYFNVFPLGKDDFEALIELRKRKIKAIQENSIF